MGTRSRPEASFLNRSSEILIALFAAGCCFSIAFAQSALTLAILCWAALMFVKREFGVPRTPLDFYFLAYLVIGIFSMLFAGGSAMFLLFFKRVVLISIVYLVAGAVARRGALVLVLATLCATMAIMSVVGIPKYLLGPGGLEGRLTLTQHYMTLGGILMIMALLAFSFAVSPGPRRWRMLAGASGLLMLPTLLFTYTRSSWLGFIAGFLFLALMQGKKLLVGLVAVAALAVVVAPTPFRDRAASILDPRHPNNAERVLMWKAGLQIMRDHALTGVGDVDMSKWYDAYKPAEARQRAPHLHSNPVMFGATLGIPGLLFFLALSAKIFALELGIIRSLPAAQWLLKSTALGSLAAFIGFQVNGLFEWNFGDSEIAMLLWLTIGLALSAEKIYRKQAEHVPASRPRS